MTQPPAVSSVPSVSAGALTTATPASVTSLVLSGGTYLVWGFVDVALTASLTVLTASLSLAPGALSSQAGNTVLPGSGLPAERLGPDAIAQQLQNLVTTSGSQSMDVGPTTLTIPPNTTATLYLVAQATFSAGSVSAYGSLFAYPLPG